MTLSLSPLNDGPIDRPLFAVILADGIFLFIEIYGHVLLSRANDLFQFVACLVVGAVTRR